MREQACTRACVFMRVRESDRESEPIIDHNWKCERVGERGRVRSSERARDQERKVWMESRERWKGGE